MPIPASGPDSKQIGALLRATRECKNIMISTDLIGQITSLQTGYFGVLEALLDVDSRTVKPETSFARIHSTSQDARESFDKLVELALSPGMQQTPVSEFRCAIIGSSNHGKTSVLVEMFPDLAERGLLITDVKDTTSQALMIKSGARSDMVFRPWKLDQIRYLVDINREELARRHIEVQYREDHVEIDGDEADFESNVKSKFKFGIRHKLKPFAGTYALDTAKAENVSLISRLTTKVDYSQTSRPQDIVVNDEAFNDLQFRVAVRSVEMGSDFSEINRWLDGLGDEKALADNLMFIDTPGLKAGGSDSDEVLRHVLSKKNQQIAVELLKNDELDLIVHLVLCGQQSDFASLWSHLEGVDSDILQDLGNRIIVAVNGFNIYFDNPDLSRRWKGGDGSGDDDHFNVTIQSNILGKMSERGALAPLNICFLDVRRVIESRGTTYQDYYRERKAVAESWATPNGVGYTTLRRLGILDRYKANLEALCDPQDCGKGFLVRQIVEAWKSQGPKLMVRRFVVRSRLFASIRDMKALLGSYYNAEGQMTRQSVTDALKSTLSFIDAAKPDAIDRFCRKEIDPFIEKEATSRAEAAVKQNESGKDKSWSVAAFRTTVSYIFARIKAQNIGLNPEIEGVLNHFLTGQLRVCAPEWGYSTAKLPLPTKEDKAPRELLIHALKYHSREFLHKCVQVASSDDNLAGVMQDDEDKHRMKELIAEINRLHAEAERLCLTYGVVVK